ncbi:MAG: nucleotidyltransferase family protein [Magnetococcales bacterium]|nr:nucleotidyltransferase family protein [Magnetococcales bacterium]
MAIFHGINLIEEQISHFCQRHHIQRLSLFGSILGDEFGPDSDIDVLVEFQPGHTPGLAFFTMEMELSNLLGRKVDLNTPGFLSARFRDQVISDAKVCYVSPSSPGNQASQQLLSTLDNHP